MEDQDNRYRDLGWANGWKASPREVQQCREKGHQLNTRKVGSCCEEVSCDACKIIYRVDSSD